MIIFSAQADILDSCKKELDRTVKPSDLPFSVGISTFDKRFNQYLKPLVSNIRAWFSGDIFISINGNNKEPFNQKYRKEILEFVSGLDNVYVTMHPTFTSLAKMWNETIINSTTQHVLLLNDDTIISGPGFFDDIKILIEQNNGRTFKVETWCCAVVNKDEIRQVGWFDENFLGIGCEDFDFEIRHFAITKNHIPSFNGVRCYSNIIDNDKDILPNQRKFIKYSKFNFEYLTEKYEISDTTNQIVFKYKAPPQYTAESFYQKNIHNL